MPIRATWLHALALLLGLAGAAAAQPVQAELTPMADRSAAAPGAEVRLALRVTLPEAFHVNANQPRDPSLIPAVLTIRPPDGVEVLELVYPEPYDLEQVGSPEPLLVYDHEFVIGARLAVAGTVTPGDLVIGGSLRYQACDDRICYFPVTGDTAWTLAVGDAGDVLDVAVFEAIPFGTGSAPPAAPAPVAPAPAPGAAEDAASLMAQLDGFEIRASTGGYLGSDDFLTFLGNAEAGVREPGLLEGRGVLAMLLVVLLGGLALNLTPCVLPMIPINLAIIGAGANAGSRRRGFLLGSAYGAAMAVVYGALGLIVILTAGTFGTINASPWFNTAIALLFVALGLAMFDVFHIDFTRFSTRFQMGGQSRGSFLLAFGMGAVAALLAGACVAPVVIQVVLFSSDMYAGGTVAALALPFLLGIGMAIPWPIAGAGISALPKPGPWMVRVKQGFGVVILVTAAYYGYLGYTLFADRWVDPEAVSASVERMIEEGWQPSLAAGLAEAQAQGKPVLVDLWATWCKNCLTMDATTLSDPTVTGALDAYVKVKFQAEVPDQSPAREVMQHFGAIGLPTYVVLQPAP
jgi:thiol:disulfide interchange protein DsbD